MTTSRTAPLGVRFATPTYRAMNTAADQGATGARHDVLEESPPPLELRQTPSAAIDPIKIYARFNLVNARPSLQP